jgi:type IV pilus assembly protein PilX
MKRIDAQVIGKAGGPAGAGPAIERGVALIIGLVILAVLSMIGVAAFSISTQEERMAGNSRDRMRAFEAAEAALRDCEDFIKTTGPVFTAAGNGGMYTAPGSDAKSNAELIVNWQDTALVRINPTLSASNPEWSLPPACIAEQFKVVSGTTQLGQPINSSQTSVDRITAQGYGLNPGTIVRLEAYYAQ